MLSIPPPPIRGVEPQLVPLDGAAQRAVQIPYTLDRRHRPQPLSLELLREIVALKIAGGTVHQHHAPEDIPTILGNSVDHHTARLALNRQVPDLHADFLDGCRVEEDGLRRTTPTPEIIEVVRSHAVVKHVLVVRAAPMNRGADRLVANRAADVVIL